ncbi:hypothetical protein B0A53_01360 [Rhodotorula sp. CCFEE 5036]|nr:hypothetical protein B0A53_01360 [Rhodotorula sp. CCFEE 5036]
MSDTRPDASGSKSNDDAQHHHRDGVAAGTAQANDTRATSAELDREGEQATKRKRSRITQACRRCKTRRARCDGVTPACGECVRASVDCEYPDPNEDGRKRRRSKAPPHGGVAAAATTRDEDPRTAPEAATQLPVASTSHAAAPQPPTFWPVSVFSQPRAPLQNSLPPPPTHRPYSYPPLEPPTSEANFAAVHMLADAASMPPQNPFDLFAPFSLAASDPRLASPATTDTTNGTGDASVAGMPAGQSVAGSLPGLNPAVRAVAPNPPPDENAAASVPKLSYLRPFGPSGIQPGLEQIVISIAAPPAFSRDQSPSPVPAFSGNGTASTSMFDGSAPSSFPYYQHGSQVPAFSSQPLTRTERFFEEGSDLPRAEIKNELLDVFFRCLGSLFPFLNRRSIENLDNGDSPASVDVPMLVNSIYSVAVKGPDPARSPGLYGVPFADKAKSMLIPLLGYPTTRTVQSILLLSFHEFGLNNDGSFWAFAGMGLRMAQDLGLHLDIEHANLDLYTRAVNRLTWWAVLAHDRMLSLGTGRPVTIKSKEISVPPPTDDDIRIVSGVDAPVPSAFPAYCRLMLLFGDMCDIVNCVKGKWKMSSSAEVSQAGQSASATKGSPDAACPPPHQPDDVRSLEPLEDAITRTYAELAPHLRWSSLNFRKHHDIGNGPIFLHLHLWYHCVLIMLYSPPLIYPQTKAARMSLADRLSVVTRCCLQVSQIIGVAELVGDHPDYEAAPFVNQPFFVAASAWIKDHHIRTGQCVLASSSNGSRHVTPTDLLAQSAAENFALCQNALARQEKYWLGCGWLGALASRKAGQASRTSIKAATAQLSTFVSEHEMAVFRRLAKRIGGEAHTPELDNDTLAAFFNALQTDAFTAQNHHLTSDDLAMAYTFASTFQDASHFTGPPQLPRHQ